MGCIDFQIFIDELFANIIRNNNQAWCAEFWFENTRLCLFKLGTGKSNDAISRQMTALAHYNLAHYKYLRAELPAQNECYMRGFGFIHFYSPSSHFSISVILFCKLEAVLGFALLESRTVLSANISVVTFGCVER